MTFEEYVLNEKRSIQDKVDSINSFAKDVKAKDIETVYYTYIEEKEHDGDLVKNYDIVLKKYHFYNKLMKYIEKEGKFTDPVGGHGLASHK